MIHTADLTSRARELEASGNLTEAIDLYREALDAQGGEEREEGVAASAPFLLTHIADLHRRRGDDARAFEFFRRAGEQYTEQGLLSNAIAVWNRVRESYPDRPEPYLALTRLHRRVGLEDEASSDLEAYLELAREAGRLEDADHELRALLAAHPAPGLCRAAARFLREEGGRPRVEDVFEEAAVRREEDGADGDVLLEWLAEWNGGPAPAADGPDAGGGEPGDAGRSAPAGNGSAPDAPTLPEAADDLGAESELRRGLELLDELLELEPDNVELRRRKVRYAERVGEPELRRGAYLELAGVLARSGEERAARLLYESVLEEDPENGRARARLNRIESQVLDGKQGPGASASRDPADAGAGGEMDEEQKAAREALSRRLWREFEASLNELPWLHAATRAFQSVGPDSPPPVSAFEMLGHYLTAQGKLEEAADVLSSGLELAGEGPEAADLLYSLVVVHRKLGDGEAADGYLERLAAMDDEVRAVLSTTRIGPQPEA